MAGIGNDVLLARIDERTEQILNGQQELYKAVFTGNGHPSLMARVESLEAQLEQHLVVCAECRKIVYSQRPEPKPAPADQSATQAAKDNVALAQVALAALDGKKTVTIERWKFLTAVAAGVFTFLAAVVAILT